MANYFKGRLERWNDGKGFGFIRPENGQKDIFIHISALPKDNRRPLVGDIIRYRMETDQNGRMRAADARIESLAASFKRKKPVPSKTSGRSVSILASVLMLLVLAGGWYFYRFEKSSVNAWRVSQSADLYRAEGADAILKHAFDNRQSNIPVEGNGTVLKQLPDDNQGSRHQRFIIRLDSGQTLLIAHNIDLAPRIDNLSAGDTVQFFGEYEWNEQGGVIHWTHLDPEQKHVAGWLKHHGTLYQ